MIKVHNEIPQWDTPPIEVSHDGNDVSHGGVNVSHGGFHVSHGGTIPWRISMYPMAVISFTDEQTNSKSQNKETAATNEQQQKLHAQ